MRVLPMPVFVIKILNPVIIFDDLNKFKNNIYVGNKKFKFITIGLESMRHPQNQRMDKEPSQFGEP